MAEKTKKAILKKHLLSGVACFALAGSLLAATAQGAHANDYNGDAPEIANAASSATTSATTVLMQTWQQMLNAMTMGVDMAKEAVKTQIATMMADSRSYNNRTDIDTKTAMDIALKYNQPLEHSACALSQRVRALDENDSAAQKARQAAANSGERGNDPATNIGDIKAEFANGLAPCTPPSGGTQDNEYSANQAMGCTQKWGGRWERAGRTEEAIFAYNQMPVPPNFTPPKNGVYQEPPVVTDEKYMPFVAAYTYCQHITPRHASAPQTSNGKMTTATLGVGDHADSDSISNTAYTTCMALLEERKQYGSQVNSAYADMHTNQATACTADVNNGILDSDPQYGFAGGATGTCQSDGRSKLQAMRDKAYRDGANSYEGKYLKGSTPGEITADRGLADSQKASFDNLIAIERQQLLTSIQVSRSAQMNPFSAMGMPVTTSTGGN